MPIGVALVGGLVGNADREIRDDGGDEVKPRVQGLGKDAEASRANHEKGFEGNQKKGGADAQQRRAFLLPHFFDLPCKHLLFA